MQGVFMTRRILRPLAVFAVLSLLGLCAACVKLERQPVDKHFYALDVTRPGEIPAGGAKPGALLVRRLQMSPRVSGRELVYRMSESGWTADYYNMFFVPPADMLSENLRSWLAGSGLYANVVAPASLLEPAYILEGNVTSLYGDFSVTPAQAVVEMQFLLLHNEGAERRVLLTKEIRRTAPLAGNSPQELVHSLRQAVAGAYAELESALRAAPVR
jgi:cholesterol transport system auxiliary component